MTGSLETLGSASSPPCALSRQAALPGLSGLVQGPCFALAACLKGNKVRSILLCRMEAVPQRQSRWPREKFRASALRCFPDFSIPGVPWSLCNQERARSRHSHGGGVGGGLPREAQRRDGKTLALATLGPRRGGGRAHDPIRSDFKAGRQERRRRWQGGWRWRACPGEGL